MPKARIKILDAPKEVPDDVQASLKSETSYLDQIQQSKEVKGKSQKESEQASTLKKGKDVIQTLVNKEGFMLGITETRLGCHQSRM